MLKRTIDVIDSEPILLFGGPYSNLMALKEMHRIATQNGILPTQIICTGDIFAYGAEPQACLELIQEWGIHCIKGNCEQSFIEQSPNCGCGFDEISACALLSNQWYNYCIDNIDAGERAWLSELPDAIEFNYGGKKCLAFHASVDSNNEFIFPSHDDAVFQHNFNKSQADILITGHSGIPFNKTLTINGKDVLWHNPGVIGMPANDGTHDTWYSMIRPLLEHHDSQTNDNQASSLIFETKRLRYDYSIAHQSMINNHCSIEYANCLLTGLWPSLESLPDADKPSTGKALPELSLMI